MDATTLDRRPEPRDLDADLALLTGPAASDLVRAVLEPHGAKALRWRAGEVAARRGGVTVRLEVDVAWPDGRRTHEVLGAATGALPPGAVVLEDGDDRVAVWAWPHDPALPGLAAACDEQAVAALLEDLGVSRGPVQLRPRAYRPTRRAVVEAVGASGSVYLKVVRPERVEALHRTHRLLVDHGVPAPQSLGWTPEGLMVLQALPGPTMREALLGGTGVVPAAGAVTEVLDRLPVELLDLPPRPSWLERVGHYARVTARVLPDQKARLQRIVGRLDATAVHGPTVPVHGDLYDAQLIVSGRRITGLLDVDTIGPGDRIDDLACLLGHLSVLAVHRPDQARTLRRLGATYLADFEASVPAPELRRRVAAVVVSLATGPHRVQQANWEGATRALVELALRWVDSADRAEHPGRR